MVYIAVFAVLIAICSWISIPTTVPFTLQTFAVFLAVGVLGGKRGSLSVLIYILLGAVGIPVFAGFSGGFGILLGQTGGYIVGFLCIINVADGSASWKEDLGTGIIHGSWSDCMLCDRNRMVYGGLCQKFRSSRACNSTWLVCHSFYYS